MAAAAAAAAAAASFSSEDMSRQIAFYLSVCVRERVIDVILLQSSDSEEVDEKNFFFFFFCVCAEGWFDVILCLLMMRVKKMNSNMENYNGVVK